MTINPCLLGMVWFMIRMVFSWDVFLNCLTMIIGKLRQNQRRNIDTQYISSSMKIYNCLNYNLREDRKFDSFVLHKEYPKSVRCNRTVHRGKPDFWVCCGARALVNIGKSHTFYCFPRVKSQGGKWLLRWRLLKKKKKPVSTVKGWLCRVPHASKKQRKVCEWMQEKWISRCTTFA